MLQRDFTDTEIELSESIWCYSSGRNNFKILEVVRYFFTFYFYNNALVCSSNN